MRKNCLYRNGERWVKGVVVGEKIEGLIFKRKKYLVEVTKQDIWFDSRPYIEREMYDSKDVIID